MRGTKLAFRTVLVGASLLIACGAASAREMQCDVDSDYDLSITPRSVILTRATGSQSPKAIVMRDGRLFVDDDWVKLSPEDSRRIADYEKTVRATMPLAQQIGRDAADIAFTALGEVAAGLSSNPKQTRANLDQARAGIDRNLAHAISANRFSGNELGHSIASAITEVLPIVIGDIVGGAVSAAFSGDQARLQRMDNLDKDIERRIEPRAKKLEKSAEMLCRHMEALDGIDDALAYRLPDGSRLDLLDTTITWHDEKVTIREDKR
jgi:hypothetical protein